MTFVTGNLITQTDTNTIKQVTANQDDVALGNPIQGINSIISIISIIDTNKNVILADKSIIFAGTWRRSSLEWVLSSQSKIQQRCTR